LLRLLTGWIICSLAKDSFKLHLHPSSVRTRSTPTMEVEASTRSNIVSSRRTIPRPWLNRNQEVEKVKTASLEILDKPTWTVSWSKLSSCFWVIRDQTDDERHNGFRDASLFPTFPAVLRDSSASLSSSPDLEDVSEGSHARIYRGLYFPHPDTCLLLSLRADLYRVLRQVTTRLRLRHSLLCRKHTFNLQAPRCHLHDQRYPRQSRLRHLLLRVGNLR
jgi:hypothetical protein